MSMFEAPFAPGMETMQGSFDPFLVVTSYLIASCAAYVALTVARRMSSSMKGLWLALGALSMAGGIWSMHFVGMLAFSLPIPLGYDGPLTLLSLVIAIVVSLFALHEVSRPQISSGRLLLGGVLMGSGIAAMHYTGMAAMKMQPAITYDPWLFAASILIAIGASIAAMWTCFVFSRKEHRHRILPMIAAAAVMGLAIVGMHYTGMFAANFPPGAICGAVGSLDAARLGQILAVGSTVLLASTIIVAFLDGRYETATSKLNRSLEAANAELERLAMTDPLTGLASRTALDRHLRALPSAGAAEQYRYSVLFVDLDGFKAINDEFGHKLGDDLLMQVADRLRASVRPGDLVARFGGDEFIIIAETRSGPSVGESIARRICQAIEEPYRVDGHSLNLSCSIGLASYPDDGEQPDELISRADIAMFDVKGKGRAGFRHFTPELGEKASSDLKTSVQLRRAINENELELYYQPKINAETRRICGAEALLRWNHPERGLLPPAEFIGLAEKFGLINALGNWVVREASRTLGSWQRRGGVLEQLDLSINASSYQFRDRGFAEAVSSMIARHGYRPERLIVEITETAAMERAPQQLGVMEALSGLGVRLSIDDFGTGYSSLSYLGNLPIKEIKIDRSFITNLEAGSDSEKIVWAILDLARRLGLHVVVEGVETEVTARHIAAMGAPCLQGYFYGRPVPLAEFEARVLAEHQASGHAEACAAE